MPSKLKEQQGGRGDTVVMNKEESNRRGVQIVKSKIIYGFIDHCKDLHFCSE